MTGSRTRRAEHTGKLAIVAGGSSGPRISELTARYLGRAEDADPYFTQAASPQPIRNS
jgi:hypothetical protein